MFEFDTPVVRFGDAGSTRTAAYLFAASRMVFMANSFRWMHRKEPALRSDSISLIFFFVTTVSVDVWPGPGILT